MKRDPFACAPAYTAILTTLFLGGCGGRTSDIDGWDGEGNPRDDMFGSGGEAGSGGSGGAQDDGSGSSSGTGGTSTTGGQPNGEQGPIAQDLEGSPARHDFVRLTNEQWENSARAIFELPRGASFASELPLSPSSGNFSNNERDLYVDEGIWVGQQRAAEAVAQLVAGDLNLLQQLGGVDDRTAFIQKVGKRAFRRPLTEDELAQFDELWTFGAENSTVDSLGDPERDGARLFVGTLLQSPHFVYRIETSPAGERLEGWELGTKLALLLTNATPSDALLEAAESGALDTDDGLRKEAETLLSEGGAPDALVSFFKEQYRVNYERLTHDPQNFPEYTPEVSQSLAQADSLFFETILEGGGLREVLSSKVVFVDELTAPYYGLVPPASGFQRVTVADRPGFLTRVGFLAGTSDAQNLQPIHRGTFVLRRVLCADMPSPLIEKPRLPNGIGPGQTNRERIESHTNTPPCVACHGAWIDPLGFAFEHFDAMGQWREQDNGAPVDATGSIHFSDERASFDGVEQLSAILAEDPLAHTCFSARLAEFALGRDLHELDLQHIEPLSEASQSQGASLEALLLRLIQSPLFTHASGEH